MFSVGDRIINRALGRANVLFSCCTHRNFHVDAMTQVMHLIANKKHIFTWMPMKGDALIDRSRSRVASFFMRERDDDILFMVDDDENFSAEDVVKVVDHVMGGMDICGGMVMLKKPATMIGNYIEKNILFFDDQNVTFGKDEKPVEIRFLGSGFMAVHRRVFRKMIDEDIVPFCHPHDVKFWPFFQPFPWKNEKGYWVYLSEDWAFCKRARDLGFKVWLDPSILISHLGEYGWDITDARRPQKEKWDEKFSITIA